MSTSPTFNPPWWRRLLQIPSKIFNGTVRVASRLWRYLVGYWNTVRDFVSAHPKLTAVLVSVILIVLALVFHQVLAKAIVTAIFGFGFPGIRAGSIAAKIQSFFFGGSVPAGSFFSFFQSFGAR